MCGICGIAGVRELPPETYSAVKVMNDHLTHRGPDDYGVWSDSHAILGQRRLSIIDLSERGRQPMTSWDERFILSCNGEIYNHKKLRTKLHTEGYQFKSDTDVETLIPLYEQYGNGVCSHLVGMFAFAIWDSRERELFLCRDRVGEKPLYYAETNGKIAFASEMKSLLQLDWVDNTLCEEIIPNMFYYGVTPPPLTPFKGIKALPPATWLRWKDGNIKIERYWGISFDNVRPRSINTALEEYEHVLNQSTSDCLTADVPVGIMLSGGVDSSTIALMAMRAKQEALTFCVTNKGKEHTGEGAISTQVSKILKTKHRIIPFGLSQNIENLPRIIQSHDQPFNNYACWFADELAKEMRKEVKVILTGNAADELFGGYTSYSQRGQDSPTQKVLNMLPSWAKSLLGSIATGKIRQAVTISSQAPINRLAINTSRAVKVRMSKSLTPHFLNRWRDYQAGQHLAKYVNESAPRTLLQASRYTDLMVTHHHGHAVLSDIAGMAHGLEYRNPFLDHRLMEFAFSLEDSLLIPNPNDPTQNKFIMKRYLQQYLPEDIVYIPKRGFGYDIDIPGMLRTQFKEALQRQLTNERLLSLNVFAPDFLKNALNDSLHNAWLAITFSIWADIYLFGQSPNQVAERLSLEGERSYQ